MHGLFGEIQISEEAHQRRQNPARFRPVKGLNGLAELFGHRRRHLRQASKRNGSIQLRSGFPTRNSSVLRSLARRQQAQYRQVTHRQRSGRMTGHSEKGPRPRKLKAAEHKVAIKGSTNWPDLRVSPRHFQRDHDRRSIKWPRVQKGAIIRPQVHRSGGSACSTRTYVASDARDQGVDQFLAEKEYRQESRAPVPVVVWRIFRVATVRKEPPAGTYR